MNATESEPLLLGMFSEDDEPITDSRIAIQFQHQDGTVLVALTIGDLKRLKRLANGYENTGKIDRATKQNRETIPPREARR